LGRKDKMPTIEGILAEGLHTSTLIYQRLEEGKKYVLDATDVRRNFRKWGPNLRFIVRLKEYRSSLTTMGIRYTLIHPLNYMVNTAIVLAALVASDITDPVCSDSMLFETKDNWQSRGCGPIELIAVESAWDRTKYLLELLDEIKEPVYYSAREKSIFSKNQLMERLGRELKVFDVSIDGEEKRVLGVKIYILSKDVDNLFEFAVIRKKIVDVCKAISGLKRREESAFKSLLIEN
jgi:hypothetical protein